MRTGQTSTPGCHESVMCSPISRRSIFSDADTKSFRSTTRGMTANREPPDHAVRPQNAVLEGEHPVGTGAKMFDGGIELRAIVGMNQIEVLPPRHRLVRGKPPDLSLLRREVHQGRPDVVVPD